MSPRAATGGVLMLSKNTIKKLIYPAILLGFLLGGELVARFVLGLGDPPLSVADPEIEYMFAPNQDCRRFGNRVVYNNVSMRNVQNIQTNEPFSGFRVLMMGDSVLNGGSQTDHKHLATTLAQEVLEKDMKIPVQILHCSAGSWGPGNYSAYIKRYGDFDSNSIGFVLSSHDVWDVPDFTPILGI
ncbi:MAG: hypothetical protein FWF96_02305 [Kiritimatiellaeota bacterium]|nr:hypothetical protein [Kiritimatiellota bacterium]